MNKQKILRKINCDKLIEDAKQLSTQSDMMIQFAKLIRQEFEAKGWTNVRVFADVFVSVNGRRNARYIPQDLDLSRASLGKGFWLNWEK